MNQSAVLCWSTQILLFVFITSGLQISMSLSLSEMQVVLIFKGLEQGLGSEYGQIQVFRSDTN